MDQVGQLYSESATGGSGDDQPMNVMGERLFLLADEDVLAGVSASAAASASALGQSFWIKCVQVDDAVADYVPRSW